MKRRSFCHKLPTQFKFIRAIMMLAIISFFVNAYVAIKMLGWNNISFKNDVAFLASQLNFGAILLVFSITITYILHKGFGALFRIEDTLEKIIDGNRSLRIRLRKGDTLLPLVDKINTPLSFCFNNSFTCWSNLMLNNLPLLPRRHGLIFLQRMVPCFVLVLFPVSFQIMPNS